MNWSLCIINPMENILDNNQNWQVFSRIQQIYRSLDIIDEFDNQLIGFKSLYKDES